MPIHWIANPILFRIGAFEPRWYALFFVVGMILSYRFAATEFQKDGVSKTTCENLFVVIFVSGIIGARLGHVLFYEPGIYLSQPWRILKIWEGGLASHGAVAGTMIGGWIYERRHKLGWLFMADRISVAFLCLGGFIRIGNLFNSEIIGKPTQVPWGIIFQRVDSVPRHPTQLYEALFYFAFYHLLKRVLRLKEWRERRGAIFGIWLVGVFAFRFAVELLKENQVGFESDMVSHLGINMGQTLSLPLIAAGIWLIWRSRRESTLHTRSV